MSKFRVRAALAGVALFPLQQAYGHAVAGPRIFVNTDLIDDPGVSDEADLPLISLQSPDGKSWVTDAHLEWDKTILPNLGFGIGTDYNWISHDLDHDNANHGGFDDPFVQLKYVWITIPEHEFMSSVQVTEAFGRAGTTGIDSGFDTTTVSGFFGKGLGDIPFNPIRPFAITGELDYNVPNTGPMGGGSITTWSGGLTLQYSIPYLQSQIKDYGLPNILANLTPLVELAWTSAAGNTILRPSNNPTTFLLGTGAAWTGRYYAISAEILWPLNGASGHNMGFVGQFHLYFDDLMPNSLGKPIVEWFK